jgi:NADPH2:quinone reductase
MPKAVVCRELGPPESLRLEMFASVPLKPGEVRVAVRAAGINFPDILMAAGEYQLKPPLPFTPGVEAAGDVVEVNAAEGVKVGDRVIVKMRHGAYCDEAVTTPTQLVKLPSNFDYAEGATFLAGHGTAYHGLIDRARLQPGEVLLVHGAGGGVGLAAVDVARALGARVIAAASSTEKLDGARALGAADVINYATEDLKVRAKELSGGGVDVVVDPVGGDLAEPALRATGWNGRFLVIGFAGGIEKLPANLVLLNNRTLIGVDWGAWTGRNQAGQRQMLDEILAAVADGRLHPPAPNRERLEDAGAVLQSVLDRQLVGKTVLVP